MSINHTISTINALGIHATYNRVWREYRIAGVKRCNRLIHDTCPCYHTSDAVDAIQTATWISRTESISTDLQLPIATE